MQKEIQPTRQQISDADLQLMVIRCVDDLVANNRVFTAYGVTLALRAINPNVEIMNDRVRPFVQNRVNQHPEYGTNFQQAPDGIWANHFMPVDQIPVEVDEEIEDEEEDAVIEEIVVEVNPSQMFSFFDDDEDIW